MKFTSSLKVNNICIENVWNRTRLKFNVTDPLLSLDSPFVRNIFKLKFYDDKMQVFGELQQMREGK